MTTLPHPATGTDPTTTTPFTFPSSYSFPPFFTPQPTLQTRSAQLKKWSSLIQKYCAYHNLYLLNLNTALDTPLFHNATLKKRLSLKDAREVVEYMCSVEGDERAEWVPPVSGGGGSAGGAAEKSTAYIYWRKPEEWGNLIASWVDETGQKGSVLTLYELIEGEATVGQEFYGMDSRVLQKSLATLVKKGRAQVFGTEDQQGVKFF
jgi:ESCRT-II complex subunit VPS25